jgi:hypothetical protein
MTTTTETTTTAPAPMGSTLSTYDLIALTDEYVQLFRAYWKPGRHATESQQDAETLHGQASALARLSGALAHALLCETNAQAAQTATTPTKGEDR